MKNDQTLSAFQISKRPTIQYRSKPRVPQFDWTDERVTELRRLQMDGLSTSQIAAKLGNVSRNAVIGKLHRLGMTGPRSGHRFGGHGDKSGDPMPKPSNVLRSGEKRQWVRSDASDGDSYWRKTRPLDNGRRVFLRDFAPKVSAPVSMPPPHADDIARISYAKFIDPMAEVAIPRTACRWPIGEPLTGFCGCEKVPGSSYCAGHLARSVARTQGTMPNPYFTLAIRVLDPDFDGQRTPGAVA